MILTKDEYKVAQELARGLTESRQRKQKERFNQAIQTVNRIAESVIDRAVEIFNKIKAGVMEHYEVLEDIEETRELRELWYVPIKIKAPPMPDVPMPQMMTIRSDL